MADLPAGPASAAGAAGIPPQQQPAAPASMGKKRRRPPLACEQCRARKIRCDKAAPCGPCVKSGLPACSYAPAHVPPSWSKSPQPRGRQSSERRRPPSLSSSKPILPAPAAAPAREPAAQCSSTAEDEDAELSSGHRISTGGSGADTTPSLASDNVDWLVTRIHHLEEKLSKSVTISNSHSPDSHDSPHNADSPSQARGVSSKTKYIAQSHWMNGVSLLPRTARLLRGKGPENAVFQNLLRESKLVGRSIKEHRLKPISSLDIGRHIPSRKVADGLVEAYLRTFEGVIRVLHVPSFRQEYEAYWLNPEGARDYFIIQMQLVMALGALFHDSTFTMRAQATQWAYEAQLWLMLPPGKNRLSIVGLQAMCLLILVRAMCGVDADLVWISSGSLVRMAIYMGLHRDPSQLGDMTTFRAEMRRRLWVTVQELNVQSAFDASASPLISDADHDARPPANLDDDQLDDSLDSERMAQAAPRSGPAPVTQMSIPLELARSLPLRVNLIRHVNDFGAGNAYDETLHINSELTKVCRHLSRTVASLVGRQQDAQAPRVTQFHAAMAELLVYRCFHALHQPVMSRSLDDPKFYFSRKMHLDGALEIMHICGLSGSRRAEGPGGPDGTLANSSQMDLNRAVTNGEGTLRNILIQCLPSLIIEMMHSRSLGPAVGPLDHAHLGVALGYLPAMDDYDLRATLEACVAWSLRRVRSGETNVKCHCFVAVGLANVDAVASSADQEAFDTKIRSAAEEAARHGLEALKNLAERENVSVSEEPGDWVGGDVSAFGKELDDLGMGMDFMSDWYQVPDGMYAL